jgi:hypothetical protein
MVSSRPPRSRRVLGNPVRGKLECSPRAVVEAFGAAHKGQSVHAHTISYYHEYLYDNAHLIFVMLQRPSGDQSLVL